MKLNTKTALATALLAAFCLLLAAACNGGDEGLSQPEVERIVQEQMAADADQDSDRQTDPHDDGNDQDPAEISADDVAAMVQEALAAQSEGTVTKADVEQAIRTAMAEAPAGQPDDDQEHAVSREEMETMLQTAVAAAPQDAVTATEAERIAQDVMASIPPRTDPEEYTKYVVQNAVNRYESHGLEPTLEHYNQPRNVNGQWYVFIIGEDGTIISHHNADRLGLDLNGWVGTDTNGYNFGPEMLSATEEGKWVSYVYQNPASGSLTPGSWGQEELKNAWVVRRDGMLFGSGWYINSDEFTEAGVREAVSVFRQGGLEGIIAHFVGGDSSVAGMSDTIAYYNSADGVDGNWYAFIADRDGTFISHLDVSMIGKNLTDMFGPGGIEATKEGNWTSAQRADGSLAYRAWVIDDAGLTFGSGWFGDAQDN